MTPLPFDYTRCRPSEPDNRCLNCKRWDKHQEQTFGPRQSFVSAVNSRSRSCIHIPISHQDNQ